MNHNYVEKIPDPPEWTSFIREQAVRDCKEIFEERKVEDFYNRWSEITKQSATFGSFCMTISKFENFYQKIEQVVDAPGRLLPSNFNPLFWGIFVNLKGKTEEFAAFVAYNEKKEVGEFTLKRRVIYHPPDYIKESRFERVKISDNPRMMYVKPTKAGDAFPALFVASTACHLDWDGNMGFSFLYKDYEYFPSANIGLVRGEFTEEMLDSGDPVSAYSAQVMQFLLSQPNITNIFMIVHNYAMLFLPKLLRKFSGVIKGAICINPAFYKDQNAPADDIDVTKLPKDVPLLIIQSGFDQFLPKKDHDQWLKVGPQLSNVTMKYYQMMDHYLFPADRVFQQNEYLFKEFHVSDVALRDIAQWIRSFNDK